MLFESLKSSKIAILFLILVTVVTYGNSLFNGFVGDDFHLFVYNPFFQSWSNLPVLFKKSYITNSDNIFNNDLMKISSGEVSYRPVYSFTNFLAYWLFGSNPWGHHAVNVILHILNTIFVFCFLRRIFNSIPIAFFSASVFCVHPLQSESVCSIVYRQGVLAAFFMFLAIFAYQSAKRHVELKRIFLLACSGILYLLGLLSKEFIVGLPLILLGYDWLILKEKPNKLLSRSNFRYIWFFAVMGFYFYLYFICFPNATLGKQNFLVGNGIERVWKIIYCFVYYGYRFLLPWTVKSMLPFYLPDMNVYGGILKWGALVIFVAFIAYFFVAIQRNKKIAFFMFWIFVSFLPVSNIIPIANPVANRFSYVLLVGYVALLAIGLDCFKGRLCAININPERKYFLKCCFVVFCMIWTFLLNFTWHDNFVHASFMVRDYPNHPRGYYHLANQYVLGGDCPKALKYLKKGFVLGLEDPRAFYLLGYCLKEDLETTRIVLEKSISIFPTYARSYTGLGRYYLLKGDVLKAKEFLLKSLGLVSSRWAYGYLLQISVMEGNMDEFENLKKSVAKKLGPQNVMLKFAQHLLEKRGQLPMDIGF